MGQEIEFILPFRVETNDQAVVAPSARFFGNVSDIVKIDVEIASKTTKTLKKLDLPTNLLPERIATSFILIGISQ